MDEMAYLRLEQQVRKWAAAAGAPGLGDEAIRTHERDLEGERRPLPGRKRLLLRLEALERHLLLSHHGTYRQAMDLIHEAITRRARRRDRPVAPEEVVLVANLPGAEAPARIPLSEAPDLSLALGRLRALIGQIREDLDGET